MPPEEDGEQFVVMALGAVTGVGAEGGGAPGRQTDSEGRRELVGDGPYPGGAGEGGETGGGTVAGVPVGVEDQCLVGEPGGGAGDDLQELGRGVDIVLDDEVVAGLRGSGRPGNQSGAQGGGRALRGGVEGEAVQPQPLSEVLGLSESYGVGHDGRTHLRLGHTALLGRGGRRSWSQSADGRASVYREFGRISSGGECSSGNGQQAHHRWNNERRGGGGGQERCRRVRPETGGCRGAGRRRRASTGR